MFGSLSPIILFFLILFSSITHFAYAQTSVSKPADLPKWQCYTDPIKTILPAPLDLVITDPEQDKIGHREQRSWGSSSSESYVAYCPDCESYSFLARTWFFSRGTLPVDPNLTIDGRTWYSVDPYLDIAIETIFYDLGTAKAVRVPHETGWNNDTAQECRVEDNRWYSGNEGNVYFYFKKPFIGEHVIPPTTVAQIAASHDGSTAINWNYPVANIKLQAHIVVPQSCTINAGTMVKVDLDSSLQKDYATSGEGKLPTGYNAKEVTVPIECKELIGTDKIGIQFMASADDKDPRLYKTNNPDLGVAIAKDSQGISLIAPETDYLPVPLSPQNKGEVKFYVYPTKNSNKIPRPGAYKVAGTMVVDFL